MKTLRRCRTASLLLALALLTAWSAAQSLMEHITVMPEVASGATTAEASIWANRGLLRAILCETPDMTSSTYSLTLRDNDDNALLTFSSLAENSLVVIEPSDDSGWNGETFPLWSTGSSPWNLLATTATAEASTREVTIQILTER